MTNKEHVSGGVRIPAVRRMDGRMQFFTRHIDFRLRAEEFTDVISSEIDLLEPGLIIGFASRFYATGHKAVPVAFRGVHTGEFNTVQVPRDKFNPGRKLVPVEAPVFDIDITSLDITTEMVRQHLGMAAIPYVLAGRYPFLHGVETGNIGRVLGLELSHDKLANLDGVRHDSIYYVPTEITQDQD